MALARSPTNPSVIVTASVRIAKTGAGNKHPPILIYPSKMRTSATVQISESAIRSTVTIRYGKGRKVIIASIPPSCSGFSSGTNIGSPISATMRSRQSADFTLSRLEVPYISGITNRSRIAGKSVCLKFRRKFEPMTVSRFLAPKCQSPFPLHAIHKDRQSDKAGQYTVYYEITYTYKNTSMTENGVAYVWLHEGSSGKSCPCGCGDPNCGCANQNCGGNCCKDNTCGDNHRCVLLDSVTASCLTLGYDRYLCTECGKIEKRDYVNALGHSWQGVVVRDATCEDSGKLFEICARCGEVKATDTPKGEHSYKTYSVAAACTAPGYTVKECAVCGDRQIADVTSALPHDYKAAVTPASCEAGGSTLHLCAGCGSSFVTDYTDALGHSWDKGTTVTDATCGGEGVTEYHCARCGYHRLEGDAAKGHTPGEPATCTAPQTCTKCGAVLKNALGHDYKGEATAPTCEKMGYTTFTCSRCGDSYKGEYADATGHKLPVSCCVCSFQICPVAISWATREV